MNNAFERNILDIYREKGEIWLAELPTRIEQLQNVWGLSGLKPFEMLSYNYVLSGYQGRTPIALKLSLDISGLDIEAKALHAFAGQGVVSVLKYQEGALLLQRAIPGTPLKGHPKAIEIACNVIKRLHTSPLPEIDHFPHIKDQLTTLDKDWELPHVQLHKARTLKNQLLLTAHSPILLHGDLHQNNILFDGKDWLVIDPKGVIGFPINELWACIEKPEYDLKYISNCFNLELDTVVKWYYVHLMLAACWKMEDKQDPQPFLGLAESIALMHLSS